MRFQRCRLKTQGTIYRFGPFELHLRSRELYKGSTKLKLRPQPFRLLQVMLERAGEVVTREELRKSIWSAETFVDFEHGLNTSIKQLRGVLSDSASAPRYIETLPRIGYRLLVSVEVIEPPAQDGARLQTTSAPPENLAGPWAGTGLPPKTSLIPRWTLPLGVAVALIVALATYKNSFQSRRDPQVTSGRPVLAVLPFENLTGDAGQEYLSDGLTEEMIAQLGRIDPEHLGVIARTSAMHYKHSPKPMDEIGRELGVQYVLEGSVRREAGKLRITAQLIRMKDQTHILSRQYDRELNNLLTLQEEIAREVAGEIQTALGDAKHDDSAHQAILSANSYEAYDLYLKGRYFWNKRTAEGFRRAAEYFQQAIETEPQSSRAYAGLAETYALMGGYAGVPPKGLSAKARAAAQRAAELDEKLPEAHTAMAVVAQDFDWDWKTAEKEYRRAIELNPNYATAHHWYAEFLALMGRFDEALAEIERARQLDPMSLIIASDHGAILYYARQYDGAIEQFRAVLEMDPLFPRAAMVEAAYAQKGMYNEALKDLQKWPRTGPWLWGQIAYLSGRAGKQNDARSALEELRKLDRQQQVDPLTFTISYIGMNNKNQALSWLEKAYAARSPSLNALKVDPVYDPLRSEPRFQDLLRRFAFPN